MGSSYEYRDEYLTNNWSFLTFLLKLISRHTHSVVLYHTTNHNKSLTLDPFLLLLICISTHFDLFIT